MYNKWNQKKQIKLNTNFNLQEKQSINKKSYIKELLTPSQVK